MIIRKLAVLCLLLVAGWNCLAEQPPTIEELSKLDISYMEGQRALLGELAASSLGRQFSGQQFKRRRDLFQC